MSVEEKVGQLLIIAMRRDTRGRPILQADGAVLDQIRRLSPGGVILFGENVQTIPQTSRLIQEFQDRAAVPLFVAVDEEGGTVSRLRKANAMHATPLPPNSALSVGGTPHMAFTMGSIIGDELSALGFNMNLAPVADVVPQNRRSFIGRRSFGSDPELVAEMVSAFARGLQTHDVCAVLKHFPGHGDTVQDTHSGAVVVPHDLERLRSVEFIPFIRGIEAGADGVMTAHLQVPAVTGSDLPATFSPVVQKAILRSELGHEKLILTDALNMGAIQQFFTPEEAAVNAFRAGADLLLMPPDPDAARDAIVAAVREDAGLMAQLDASVTRILRVKHQRGILAGDRPRRDPEMVLGSPEHRREARAIIEQLSSN
jgi:beta-N-acetylhexosaminidase